MTAEKQCDDCLQIQFLDTTDPKNACFGCVHRKYKVIKDYCDIDGHYIDFFGLWEQTCQYHAVQES